MIPNDKIASQIYELLFGEKEVTLSKLETPWFKQITCYYKLHDSWQQPTAQKAPDERLFPIFRWCKYLSNVFEMNHSWFFWKVFSNKRIGWRKYFVVVQSNNLANIDTKDKRRRWNELMTRWWKSFQTWSWNKAILLPLIPSLLCKQSNCQTWK